MKIDWRFQSTIQVKNLKIQWICCKYFMVIDHITCTLKILTDLFHKTKNKNKKYFCKIVYSVLVVKMYWLNIKFIWALIAHNL